MRTEKEIEQKLLDCEKAKAHVAEMRVWWESRPDYSESTKHMFDVIDQANLTACAMLRWTLGYEPESK